MKISRHFLYIFIFLVLTILACEETDGPNKVVSAPTISVGFVADSSLLKVEQESKDFKVLIDTMTARYLRAIENEEFADTVELIVNRMKFSILLDSVTQLKNLFKSKKVRLDSVYALSSNSAVILDTVNSVFKLPLNVNADSSVFVFSYLNKKDTLTFSYKTKVNGGLDQISIIAYEVELVKSTFHKNTRHYCHEENCRSNEIVFKVYF